MKAKVEGLAFRASGVGFRGVQGLGFRASVLEFKGLGF